MRAVVASMGELTVETLDEPVPGPGEVLVEPIATGICGSDLHMLQTQAHQPDAVPARVFGHEFCAEVLDHGPGTLRHIPPGSLVCSVPVVDHPAGPQLVGNSPTYPGGFAERMLLDERRLLVVPNGLPAAQAALTEPLAVGVHAVATAQLAVDDVPLVVGCGPIGLAVIAALKIAGHRPVLAADFSPARRALAERAGADVIVDPAEQSPYTTWQELAGPAHAPSPFLDGPLPRARTVVFDCVGAPGMLAQIIEAAPQHSRLVVVGICSSTDSFVPARAIGRELSITFVFAYLPTEFAAALRWIAEGRLDVSSWITGNCGLNGVAGAFAELASPDTHCKILVSPRA